MTSVSVDDFHQDVEAAEAASEHGPVFITLDGEPRRVLIDILEYRKLAQGLTASSDHGEPLSLLEAFARIPFPDTHLNFEFPRMDLVLGPADLS